MAALYLEGRPLQWYRWTMRLKEHVLTWEELGKGLVNMYDLTTVTNYSSELSKLKQEGHNFEEYQSEFMHLSHFFHGLSDEFLINCFVSGLRDPMKFKLIAKQLTSMEQAMKWVKREEEKSVATQENVKGTGVQSMPSSSSNTGPGGPANPPKSSNPTAPTEENPVRRLTTQEVRERRGKGLRFDSNEKFISDHRCKNQSLSIGDYSKKR